MNEMNETVATPGFSRRSMLKALGTGVSTIALLPLLSEEGAEAFAAIQRSGAAPKLKALTPAQYATVDAFTEAIIPTDAHSPGAKAARVADYIDLLLSEWRGPDILGEPGSQTERERAPLLLGEGGVYDVSLLGVRGSMFDLLEASVGLMHQDLRLLLGVLARRPG